MSILPVKKERAGQRSPKRKVFGLLANGSTRCWDVAVEATVEGDEWCLEIDGPQTYLVFQLEELKVVEKALRYLELGPRSNRQKRAREVETGFVLGRFGSATVTLFRDNETISRCFIIVGPKGRSTLRLTFEGADLEMLIEAMRQVVQDMRR